jgi:hypothetical protein
LHIKEKQSFHFAPNRLSIDVKNKVRTILDDLLARGILRSSSSEYASRMVLVRKKDGNIRTCMDYRTLNKITARENLPIIEEQIDARKTLLYIIRSKGWFSSCAYGKRQHKV